MGLSATPFALLYVPLLLLSLRRGAHFVFLLAASAVFQGTSVLDLALETGSVGFSPYLVTGGVAGLLLLRLAVDRGWRSLRADLERQPPAMAWLAYFGIAAIGSLLLPRVFAGIEVHPLLGLGGIDVPKEPLAAGLSQYAQIVNLAVHAVVLIYLTATWKRGEWHTRNILAGLAAGLAVVVLVGIYERAALHFHWPSLHWLLVNNPGYKLYQFDELGGVTRVYAPFSEPSYTSAYLGAAAIGLLAHVAFGVRRRSWSLGLLVLVVLSLSNTLGATGLVTVAVGGVVTLLVATIVLVRSSGDSRGLRHRVLVGWAGLLMLLAGSVTVYRMPERFPFVHEAVQAKLSSDSVRNRARSNDYALTLLQGTYGLGVGLGGNRASSFMASLASNTGLPGLVAFLVASAMVFRRYASQRLDDARILALGAWLGAVIAVTAGIPDLNIPFFWMFVFCATLLAPEWQHRTAPSP